MFKLSPEEIEIEVEKIALRCKYEGYLRSPTWQKKRRLKLLEKDFRCEKCHRRSYDMPIDLVLDVHHKTYQNLFNEPPEDLQVLCRECHAKTHGRTFGDVQTVADKERTDANAQQPGRRS